MQAMVTTVGNVMSRFRRHLPKKKRWYVVTGVTSGNKWSGQSVKNILILLRFAIIPSDTFLWGWSIWEMTALCVSETQILAWWALSRSQTGDGPLFQLKVWATFRHSAQPVLRQRLHTGRLYLKSETKLTNLIWVWRFKVCDNKDGVCVVTLGSNQDGEPEPC